MLTPAKGSSASEHFGLRSSLTSSKSKITTRLYHVCFCFSFSKVPSPSKLSPLFAVTAFTISPGMAKFVSLPLLPRCKPHLETSKRACARLPPLRSGARQPRPVPLLSYEDVLHKHLATYSASVPSRIDPLAYTNFASHKLSGFELFLRALPPCQLCWPQTVRLRCITHSPSQLFISSSFQTDQPSVCQK